MSLAYSIDGSGKYQVAYEAMDKISIIKHQSMWWWICPCHDWYSIHVTWEVALGSANNHLDNFHMDEE